ncbi:MAG: hypothetical protein ACYCU5_16050, partial [Actinomycetes bacterium]
MDALLDLLTEGGKVTIHHAGHAVAKATYAKPPAQVPVSPRMLQYMPEMPRIPTLAESMPQLPDLPVLPTLAGLGATAAIPAEIALTRTPGMGQNGAKSHESHAMAPRSDQPPLGRESYGQQSESTNVQAPDGVMPTVESSYAAEWQDDLSVACVPCTRRHLSTARTALDGAAEAQDPMQRRRGLAIASGELAVWRQYDTTRDKMMRAREQDRLAIADAIAGAGPVQDSLPSAPDKMVLAWAAVAEAGRFARSAQPSERDLEEVRVRMQDVDGLVGYLETTMAGDQAAAPHLAAIRSCRHDWTR